MIFRDGVGCCTTAGWRWAAAVLAIAGGLLATHQSGGLSRAEPTIAPQDFDSTSPIPPPLVPEAVAAPTPAPLSPRQLAAKIDDYFAAYWKERKVTPAPISSDAEFLRRVSLDLNGKIPTAGEARAFLDETGAEKRADLAQQMIRRARFASHLAATLREMLLPGANTDPRSSMLIPPFEAWLRLRLADGVTYDKLVEELLTTPVSVDGSDFQRFARSPGPEAFTLIHQGKPEELAGSAARALLGVQVQCAQCHDHPFADWKQEQFWSFAAFFVAGTAPTLAVATAPSAEIEIPGKNKKVPPAFLDGRPPTLETQDAAGRRSALSKWVLNGNPYFARAAANRLWNHFLGRGLVHPVDDLGPNNPASHPEVLGLLAEQFMLNGFDLKYLAEAIVSTRAYQLSSRSTDPSQNAAKHFARMPVRSMTPEQLYDSLGRAGDGRSTTADVPSDEGAGLYLDTQRTQFLRKFAEPGDRSGPRGSILQALTLMNGAMSARAVDPESGPQLRAVLDSPFLDDGGRLETLFLATVTRRPSVEEVDRLLRHVAHSADRSSKRKAFGDVYWALLNSGEFALTP